MKSSSPAVDRAHGSKVLTTNKHLVRWVEKMAELCRPDSIHWVDGSKAEYDSLCERLVRGGDLHAAESGAVAGLLLCALGVERRGAGGRPDVYLLALEGCCGADE